jgi:hypothetical protein
VRLDLSTDFGTVTFFLSDDDDGGGGMTFRIGERGRGDREPSATLYDAGVWRSMVIRGRGMVTLG